MKLTDLAQQLAAQPDVSEHDFDRPFPLSKAPEVRSVTTPEVSGQKVSAYRNLRNSMWSLKDHATGKVSGHTDHVVIHNARFAVGEGSRQRVIQQGQKNVHAFVRGTVAHRTARAARRSGPSVLQPLFRRALLPQGHQGGRAQRRRGAHDAPWRVRRQPPLLSHPDPASKLRA